MLKILENDDDDEDENDFRIAVSLARRLRNHPGGLLGRFSFASSPIVLVVVLVLVVDVFGSKHINPLALFVDRFLSRQTLFTSNAQRLENDDDEDENDFRRAVSLARRLRNH